MSDSIQNLIKSKGFASKIKSIIQNGDINSLSVKSIRKDLENSFDLEQNSLKQVKDVVNKQIEEAFVKLTANENEEPEKPVVQKKKKQEPAQTNKRKRVLKEANDDKRKKRSATSKRVIEDSDSEDDNGDDNDDGSDDFMDTEDTPKKESEDQQDEEEDVKPKAKTVKKEQMPTKAPSKSDQEIKRLQQYVFKCGVRKMWHREFADCKTNAQKLNKVKDILKDLGIVGRPTLEQCQSIKADRELQQEVDGLDRSLIIEEDGGRASRVGRRSAKPKRSYVVDNSSEEEEEEEKEEEKEEESDDGENDEQEDDDAQKESNNANKSNKNVEKKKEKENEDNSDNEKSEEEEEEEEVKPASRRRKPIIEESDSEFEGPSDEDD